MTVIAMSERTPTPWYRGHFVVFGHDNRPVVDCGRPERAEGECLSNADFIVRAADAHDELVAALEYARTFAERWCHYQGDNAKFFRETLAPIDAALAKARGETP